MKHFFIFIDTSIRSANTVHTWIATPLLIFGNNKSKADLYPVTTSVLFKKKTRRFVNEQINSFPYSYVLHLNIEVKLIQSLK